MVGRKLQFADVYRLKSVSQPAVSPDGERVAFVVQGYLREENESHRNLWLASTDGQGEPHRLTRGKNNDTSPQWSPNGRYLAFLSTREDELEVKEALQKDKEKDEDGDKKLGQEPPDRAGDKPKPQIWMFDLEYGGEPRQVTRRAEGVKEFHWSPDSARIVFASRDPKEAEQEYLKSIRGKEKSKGKGPLVIDRTQHKHDRSGFLDDVKTHLFVVETATRREHQLTGGPCDEYSPRWSPDGKWICFISNRTGDADNNRRSDLWLISPDGTETRRLTFGDVSASNCSWSPDSRHVAFVTPSEPENAYVLRHAMVVDAASAKPVDILEECVGDGWSEVGGVVPDGLSGSPAENARVYPVPLASTRAKALTDVLDRPVMGEPIWVSDSGILIAVGDRGQTRLVRASLDGETDYVYPVADRSCTIGYGGVDAAGGRVALIVDRPEKGDNLFSLTVDELGGNGADQCPVQLTDFNRDLFEEVSTASYERIEFKNSDGLAVEALVAIPPGFKPGEGKAPLITQIHGGPMSYDSPRFKFDTQYFAALGYLVLMVNYRGSISYGEDFCKTIRGDWGPREHDDVVCGVNALVERGWANSDQLYCTGFSQGGIMTNWAVGHTDIFKAAASEHGMWDYIAAFGTDDCHLWWQDDLGVPWQNEEQYRRISPMSGLMDIETPLLIMAGELDWRCPLSQSEQLYVSLKKRGVATRLVIYQGENHAINTPRRAIDRIRRIVQWFAGHGGPEFSDDSADGYPDPGLG